MSQPSARGLASVGTDEVLAATYRVALALTASVGAMRAATEAVAGTFDPLWNVPWLIVLVGWIALGRGARIRGPIGTTAGYAAALVWVTLLPSSSREALLVPAFMALACVAAVGGLGWLARWLTTSEQPTPAKAPPGTREPLGWIEEDGRRL